MEERRLLLKSPIGKDEQGVQTIVRQPLAIKQRHKYFLIYLAITLGIVMVIFCQWNPTALPAVILNKKEVAIPGAVLPSKNGTLNVTCTRSFYCNPVHCQPVRMKKDALAQHDYGEISRFLFQGSQMANNNSNNNNNNKNDHQQTALHFQYWGDSITATLECDMRQWMYEQENQYNESSSLALSSDYLQLGCPWRDCKPAMGWQNLTMQTQTDDIDIIIFTIGAHYEHVSMKPQFLADLDQFYRVLEPFLLNTNNQRHGKAAKRKALLVLSPSPTNFNTSTGLFSRANLSDTKQCVPIPKMPPAVVEQRDALKTLVHRLKNATQSSVVGGSSSSSSPAPIVEFLDVYSFSMSRPLEHTSKSDCKHFCQNCGILRAWNALILDTLMNLDSSAETIFDLFGG